MLDFNEYIGSLLAALVSLQVFEIDCEGLCDYGSPTDDSLAFIAKVSDKAPHLKYFASLYFPDYCKRIDGEWVFCDSTELIVAKRLALLPDGWVIRWGFYYDSDREGDF